MLSQQRPRQKPLKKKTSKKNTPLAQMEHTRSETNPRKRTCREMTPYDVRRLKRTALASERTVGALTEELGETKRQRTALCTKLKAAAEAAAEAEAAFEKKLRDEQRRRNAFETVVAELRKRLTLTPAPDHDAIQAQRTLKSVQNQLFEARQEAAAASAFEKKLHDEQRRRNALEKVVAELRVERHAVQLKAECSGNAAVHLRQEYASLKNKNGIQKKEIAALRKENKIFQKGVFDVQGKLCEERTKFRTALETANKELVLAQTQILSARSAAAIAGAKLAKVENALN